MEAKPLFDRNQKYTAAAAELATDVSVMMTAVMREWMGRGYSFREIAHIMQAGVMDAELMVALDIQEATPLKVASAG